MTNPWLSHVAQFRKENPDLTYKEVLKQARGSYTPVKKQRGKGVADVIDQLNSDDDKLEFAGQQIDKGLAFTKDILGDETRIRRVEARQDRRDTRAKDRQVRRNEVLDAKDQVKINRAAEKAEKAARKTAIRDAKTARKLRRINR